MNEIGYDFAIPGNHEFDYGMDRFLTLNDKLSCGYYSSNLVNTITIRKRTQKIFRASGQEKPLALFSSLDYDGILKIIYKIKMLI